MNGLPKITVDYDVMAAFVAKLREEGYVAEPSPEVVEALSAQLLELQERYEQRAEQTSDGKAKRMAATIAKRRAALSATQEVTNV